MVTQKLVLQPGSNKITLPATHRFLNAGVDSNFDICAWVAVVKASDPVEREIEVVEGGAEFKADASDAFLGTIPLTPIPPPVGPESAEPDEVHVWLRGARGMIQLPDPEPARGIGTAGFGGEESYEEKYSRFDGKRVSVTYRAPGTGGASKAEGVVAYVGAFGLLLKTASDEGIIEYGWIESLKEVGP